MTRLGDQDRVRIESGHGSSPCAGRARVVHLPSLHRPDISDRGRCDVVLLGPDAALLKQPRRAATAPSVVPQAMAQRRLPTQSEPRWQKKTSSGPGPSTPRRTWLRQFHSSPRSPAFTGSRHATQQPHCVRMPPPDTCTHHNQYVPARRRRLLHLRRTTNLLAILRTA
jgi:hypothetical protein